MQLEAKAQLPLRRALHIWDQGGTGQGADREPSVDREVGEGGGGALRGACFPLSHHHNRSPARSQIPRHKHSIKKYQLEGLEGPGERERGKDWNEKPIFRTQHLHNRALRSQLWGKREAARDQQVSVQSLPPAGARGLGWAQQRWCLCGQACCVARLAPLKDKRRAGAAGGGGGALLGLLHPP